MRRAYIVAFATVVSAALALVLLREDPTAEQETAGRHTRRGPAPESTNFCGHPYIPARAGFQAVYLLSIEGAHAEMELELERRQEEGSTLLDHWLTTIRIEGSEPLMLHSVARCGPEGAEMPWSFINITGVANVDVDWRWPADLEAGIEFGGYVTMQLLGSEHRSHRQLVVGERERVIVPAGPYEARRVELTDSAGQSELRGTVWVREGIGLIRSEREVRPGERVVLELSSVSP